MSIDGTDFPETLTGTIGDDVVNALGGNDIINASQGNDVIDGGLGTDRLVFTLADAGLFAAAVAARAYTIGASSVTDSGGLLNTGFTAVENITFSTVGAGDFNDSIDASGFNGTALTVVLGNGNANVTGSAKADIINTGRGDNVVNAGFGNDSLSASRGADTLNGDVGTDRVILNMANTDLFDAATGARTYTITSASLSDSSGTLNSTMSNIERITFSSAGTGDFGETVDASGFVTGATAAFVLTVTTGAGNDSVIGTAQRDVITTGLGDDSVYGGGGDDTLFVGLGANIVDGGTGLDTVRIDFDNALGGTVVVTESAGTIMTSFNGQSNSVSNAESIYFQATDASAGFAIDASAVVSYAGELVFINSMGGSDVFIGHNGRDLFGTNYLAVDGGDTYTGNGGADWYDYLSSVAAMNGDIITDFDADDTIDLTFNTPASNSGGYLAYLFIGNAAFSNVAGQYRYEYSGGQTRLQVDSNGDGVADETLTIANGEFGLVETAAGSNLLVRANLVNGDSAGNTLSGTLGNDVINGLSGPDNLYASQGIDVIDGGVGINDRIYITTANASLFAAATGSRNFTITTSRVSDTSGLINTSLANVEKIVFDGTNSGNYGDTLNASGFVSTTTGTILTATMGSGNDTVTGTAYRDFITTGLGDDTVYGGGGDDLINAGLGTNFVDGGAGIDDVAIFFDNNSSGTLFVSSSGTTITTTLDGAVTNTIANAENVTVRFSDYAAAAVTRIDASGVALGALTQLSFDDHDGSDILIGSHGRDFFGNGPVNTIGNDVYTGNGGADIFDYTYAVNGMDGDTITDFDADDVIDLSHNTSTPGDNSFGVLANQFIGNAAFTNVAGQYRYEYSGGQTRLQVDTNGDGVADETLTIANGEFGLVENAAGSNQLVRANMVNGTAGSDLNLRGTLGNDVINGFDQVDRIYASQGIDTIDGGGFNDRLTINMWDSSLFAAASGARSYTITTNRVTDSSGTLDTTMTSIERITFSTQGTSFNDTVNVSGFVSSAPSGIVTLLLGNGDNTVVGSQYGDFISVGSGHNIIDGGAGFDQVQFQYNNSSGATLYLTGSGGTLIATLDGASVNDFTNIESVTISCTDFSAGTTIDASGLTGFAGQVLFVDTNATNIAIGHNGADFFSNASSNVLGNDSYTGNGGADIFDYTYAVGGMNGDTITDFDSDDIIDLQFNDAVNNGGGLLANQFIGNAAFTGVAGQYRYEASGDQTFVQADTDGDGVADQTLTIADGQFALAETVAGSNQLHIIGSAGSSDDDFMLGGLGNDNFYALGGNDTIATTQGMDFVDGGDGFDQLRFQMGYADRFTLATGSRVYTITGNHVGDSSGTVDTSFANVESIFLRTIDNGDFGDTVDASLSSAPIILRLGAGNDNVIGSAGDDDLGLALGVNTADAGAGYDVVYTAFDNQAGTTAYVTSVGGTVLLTVGGVQTASIVNAESVQITGYYASAVTTTIDASGYTAIAGVELVLRDSNGSDTIIGSHGNDLLANVSNNTLGNDVLTGNGGADVFDYTYASNGINGDTITDLGDDDTIDFRFNDGTVEGASPLLCNQFIGGANFSGAAGQYRYAVVGNQTQIQLDSDGDGVADQVMTIANGAFALGETAPGSNVLHVIGAAGTNNVDTLTGTLGNDSIYALGSNDIINGSQGTDFIYGGNGGGDRLFMNTGIASLFTAATGARTYTVGNGTITDSSGTLNTSFTGVERISLSTVGNGNFNDIIDASGFVSANANPLDIRLGDGNNQVIGSSGNDRVFTGFGSNSMNGGSGYDFGQVNVDSTVAASVAITNVGGTLVTNAGGVINSFVNFEEVWVGGGASGAITLDASAYTAISGLVLVLMGHNGSDTMIGSSANDIFGNITGQVLGSDIYTGHGGADIYDYTFAADSMNGDTITDFDIDDVIDLRFNNLELGGSPLLANHFIGAAAFSGTAGEYRYQIDGTHTLVQVDSDGDTFADQTLTISNGAFVLAETAAGSNVLTLAAVIDPLDAIVADGYIEGAIVFLDTNGNHLRDANEAWTVTGADGGFTLNVNQAGTIVAIGGTNLDTHLANTMTLVAPSHADVVNPLTTLVQAVIDQGGGAVSVAQAQAKVLGALGLNGGLNLLTYDPLAHSGDADALAAQKAAAMISNLVAAAEGSAQSSASTETALIGALASLVTTTAPGATINLANAATLTPLLTTALPGTNVAAIAAEVAVESESIANAANLGAIATAQVQAQAIDYSLDNVLTGDGAANHLSGLGGNDTLHGQGGDDRLEGGIGNDTLDGGVGNDRMEGGAGNDLYLVDAAGDVVVELPGEGYDTVRSSVNYTLTGNVERLELTGDARDGTGNALDNFLVGDGWSNHLSGGAGNDTLFGGGGMDYLAGGTGNDIFWAELGAPVSTKVGMLSIDVILDFGAGDRIDLTGIDAMSGRPGIQSFNFIGTSANKNAGDLSYKVYDSVQGAEKALGVNLDGVDGTSPYAGPVTILYGNHDGGTPDFALALFGVNGIGASALIMDQHVLING